LDLLGGDAGRRWRRRSGGRRRHGHLLLHRRGLRRNRWVGAAYLPFVACFSRFLELVKVEDRRRGLRLVVVLPGSWKKGKFAASTQQLGTLKMENQWGEKGREGE
jgi:hypothetical protein